MRCPSSSRGRRGEAATSAVSVTGVTVRYSEGPALHTRPKLLPSRARGLLLPLAPAALLLLAALGALLAGGALADRVQRVAVGPGDGRALVGFYEREQNELGAFRWARPGAALFLYGFDGRPAIVSLRLNAARPGSASAAVTVHAEGSAPASFEAPTFWRRYTLLAPTRRTADTPLFLYGSAFRPAGDERDLLVALSGAEARPAETSSLFPPFERTVFLASLPLLGWLLTRRLFDRRPEASGAGRARSLAARPEALAGLALVLAVGWAAARPAAAGYWLPTFGWPWWPFLPLALLAAWPRRRLIGAGVRHVAEAPGGALARPWLEVAAVAGLTALAIGLRLVALDQIPAGLWRDEARHGLIALQIWQDPTYRPVYVVQGADLPALLFYLIAPVVGLLGPGVMSVRLVSALAGGLTPLALWWAARPLVGPRAAVAAAGLLSWASWSLSMSRWAFPATLDQLLTLAALGLVWRALGDRPAGDARPAAAGRRPLAALALAGALGGLAAYTYHTGRLAPLVLAALAALWLGRDRFGWRRALPGLAAAVVAGALVLAPLLRFVAEDFQGYNRRTGAVAFYNEQDAGVHAPLLLLLRNGERYLLMWHVAGERNGRHHAPGAPMLDPLSGALFAAGLLLAALAWRQRPGRILLAWLALGLLPGLLSTGAPHAMRALPSLAPACALAAWGLDRLLHSAQGARRSATLAAAASALLLAASLALNAWLYFGRMPRDPQVLAAFDVPETAMGRVVREAAADPALRDVDVFLPASVRRSDVIRFLTSGARVGYFDITTGFSAEPGEQALLLLPAGAPAETQAAALEALGPGARALTPVPRDPGGRPLLLAFGRGAGAEALLRSTFR